MLAFGSLFWECFDDGNLFRYRLVYVVLDSLSRGGSDWFFRGFYRFGTNRELRANLVSVLSLSGRIKVFLDGLLTSQNVVYFVAITLLFLCFKKLG